MSTVPRISGAKCLISGVILTVGSFVALMANLYNTYQKASTMIACPTVTGCGLSINIHITQIATAVFLLGLILMVIGTLALGLQHHQHKHAANPEHGVAAP